MTKGRIQIYLHKFLDESSHYVQLFAFNLVQTTQAQFTACSKRFCIYIAMSLSFFINLLVTLVKCFNRSKADHPWDLTISHYRIVTIQPDRVL